MLFRPLDFIVRETVLLSLKMVVMRKGKAQKESEAEILKVIIIST